MPLKSVKVTSPSQAGLTSFVGRRNDLVSVRQLLETSRLVTLTGIGGVGKTRLAIEAASQVQRAFPDGVYVVDLSALTDANLLPHTVTEALGIRERHSPDALSVLEKHLQDRRLLIVLDNCEHLVEPTAEMAHRVLRTAPEIRILVTSRQALRVDGERIFPVAPLLAPDPTDNIQPGTAGHYPSVALFVDRSTAAVPDFELTPDNEAAVVRLSHSLEGIPLAIELAAVRLRVLTVDELADRLDDRFGLLRESNRNLPARHRTLQALVDWSYDLCTPREKLLWARSSVFAGSFGADAVEAICTDEALPRDVVLDTIAALVDKSILVHDEHHRQSRFRMLETIRQYGWARLQEAGEDSLMARRHRDWYAELIEDAEAAWAGPRQVSLATRLQAEHPNIRLALDYCNTVPGEAGVGLRMSAIAWFWGAMDHLSEGRLWLDRFLRLETEPTRDRVWALASAAYISAFEGADEQLATWSEEAYELARDLDDPAALAFATHVRAIRLSFGRSDDHAAAVASFHAALEQYAATGVPAQYGDSLRVELAATLIFSHELDAATEIVDELYERCIAFGERWNLSYALWLRALVALFRGDHNEAERHLMAAIEAKLVFRDTLGMALTLDVLAWTASANGEPQRAARLFGCTDQVWRIIGGRLLGAIRQPYETQVRELLGDQAFDAERSAGGKLSMDEIVALALRTPDETPESTLAHNDTALTPREREVAALVAEGLSNKEIASKLVISQRTAEGHVEKILTKTGFRTRTQVATWMLQQSAD